MAMQLPRQSLLALLSDPEIQRQLTASIDVSTLMRDDPRVRDCLMTMLADPTVTQQLISRLDVSSLLTHPAVARQLSERLDIGAILSDPAVSDHLIHQLDPVKVVVPAVRQRLESDAAALDGATILVTNGIFASVLVLAYLLLVAEFGLMVLAFSLYVFAFLATATFQWVWLLLPHVLRSVVGVLIARRLPTVHALMRRASRLTSHGGNSGGANGVEPDGAGSKRVASEEGTPTKPPGMPGFNGMLAPDAATSLLPLVPVLGGAWVGCIFFDAIALVVCLVWASVTRGGALSDEQATFLVLLGLTISFIVIDVAPLLVWPLVRWALPPSYAAALSSAVWDAAGRGAPLRPSSSEEGGKEGGGVPGGGQPFCGDGMRQPMLPTAAATSSCHPAHPPPPPPPPPPPADDDAAAQRRSFDLTTDAGVAGP